MIVIADTGPINYLILIGEIDVLPALYDLVLIPPSVNEELGRMRAPEVVRLWIVRRPEWLEVRAPSRSVDRFLTHLDAGEREAILLAEEIGADQLIIDESRGRQEAKRRHLPFTGTLGILQAGAKQGLLDLRMAVARLRQTSFHISQDILDELLKSQ
jgi:predicted nucleic acid-binding protein